MTNDLDLLQQYARQKSEQAFSALVNRHLNLVHSAALRQVRSPQLAEEVVQSVFTDLARNAHRLAPDTILTAWLYQVTRRTAIDVVRREARRQLREQIATEMNTMNATAADWTHIEPLLDEAMHALDDTDRAAVLLRYFENKSLREVGATLGTSDDAAQKRVSRAVERLREFFAKRGITVGATGLVVVISANAIQAAPVGLAVTISTAAAIAGTTIATTASATAVKTIAMTTLQKTLVTATVAVLTGAGIYEARQASQLRDQVQTLQQQQAPLAEQIRQLEHERNEATRQVASLREDNDRLNRNTAELLKLRGEAARRRTDSAELAKLNRSSDVSTDATEAELKAWQTRVSKLKQRLEQIPGQKIPELQLLTEKDWLRQAADSPKEAKLETDEEFREALMTMRDIAKNRFGQMVRDALEKYAQANAGQLPGKVSDLQNYFQSPVETGTLERYELLKRGKLGDVPDKDPILVEKGPPVDDQFDTRLTVWRYSYRPVLPGEKTDGSEESILDGAVLERPR